MDSIEGKVVGIRGSVVHMENHNNGRFLLYSVLKLTLEPKLTTETPGDAVVVVTDYLFPIHLGDVIRAHTGPAPKLNQLLPTGSTYVNKIELLDPATREPCGVEYEIRTDVVSGYT